MNLLISQALRRARRKKLSPDVPKAIVSRLCDSGVVLSTSRPIWQNLQDRFITAITSFCRIEQHSNCIDTHDGTTIISPSPLAMADLNIYLLTFNCARTLIQPHKFAPHIFDALPEHVSTPDIIVLSLQEVAPIAYSFLGGSYLTPYLNAFQDAIQLVANDHVNIVTRNLGLTAIMIFAKDTTRLSAIQTAGVGVGLQAMGNKGGVGIRFMFDETQMTFVAAHLAPMEDALRRRNEDWKNIVRGMVFKSEEKGRRDEHDEDVPLLQSFGGQDGSEHGMYSPRSHLFVAGDLNYRVSEAKPTPDDVKVFPQPTDDVDSPIHFFNLLKKDQLLQQLENKNTLHGLSEAKIQFPPTYKLLENKEGNDNHWNWATHRWPSWCDRILYLELPTWIPERMTIHKYDALPQLETSDHRPVVLSLAVPLKAIPKPAGDQDGVRSRPPFQTEPAWELQRARARKKEIAVGLAAYLTLTWEGNGLLIAMIFGGLGGWLVFRSLLAV